MRNKTFTRLLCLALALLCLVSSTAIVVGAQEIKHDNLTDKTIADYKETLDLISYAEYQNLYYANAEKLSAELRTARDTLAAESEGHRLSEEQYTALKGEYDILTAAFQEMREMRGRRGRRFPLS